MPSKPGIAFVEFETEMQASLGWSADRCQACRCSLVACRCTSRDFDARVGFSITCWERAALLLCAACMLTGHNARAPWPPPNSAGDRGAHRAAGLQGHAAERHENQLQQMRCPALLGCAAGACCRPACNNGAAAMQRALARVPRTAAVLYRCLFPLYLYCSPPALPAAHAGLVNL